MKWLKKLRRWYSKKFLGYVEPDVYVDELTGAHFTLEELFNKPLLVVNLPVVITDCNGNSKQVGETKIMQTKEPLREVLKQFSKIKLEAWK